MSYPTLILVRLRIGMALASDRAVPDIIHPSIHHPLRLRLVRSFVLLVETRRLQPPDALAEAASTIYFFDDLNQSSSRQVPTFTLLRLVTTRAWQEVATSCPRPLG